LDSTRSPSPVMVQPNVNQIVQSSLSVLDMPTPNSPHAPKKFKGHYSEIEKFLDHYERLCLKNHVSQESDRCKTILQYCSRKVAEVIEGLECYQTPNWNKLKEQLLQLYDAELNKRRYTKSDLKKFVRTQRERKIRTWPQFTQYVRAFMTIGGWLKGCKKISDTEEATYFWKGIYATLRQKLENRLIAKDPDHDLKTPFALDEIRKMAESLLNTEWFDQSDNDSEDEDDSDNNDSDSSVEGNEPDSEDSDTDKKRQVRRSKGSKLKLSLNKRRKSMDMPTKADPEEKKNQEKPGSQDDVESLIRQMNNMSLKDPHYGLLYYKALKIDPDAAKVVRAPFTVGSNNRAEEPVTAARPPIQNTAPRRFDEMTCYGCGNKGHGMNNCSQISDLLSEGIIQRDSSGRIVMKDGSRIFRLDGESIVQAAKRLQTPSAKVNLVTFSPDTRTHRLPMEYDPIELDSSEGEYVYPVTRSERANLGKRKEALEEPYQTAAKRNTGRAQQKIPVKIPKPILKEIKQQPLQDHSDDDMAVDDQELIKKVASGSNQTKQSTKVQKVMRQSDLTAKVNLQDMAERLFQNSYTLTTGELLGCSPGLSQLISDKLKIKAQKSAEPVMGTSVSDEAMPTSFIARASFSKTRGLLIRLQVSCHGMLIEAIIDTGSQLNVCNSQVWKGMHQPMDTSQTINMNDANGGKGTLNGLVADVPINIGSLSTVANLFVGDHVPFQLLLGRPWQRGNFISIDERPEGTYLLF
ncbi:hypothetical protein DFH11DRAFT_1792138, partial [Phellopilus nigrolimitatus]